jgi:hypothetical protein
MVISASSTSCSAVRTSARMNSSSSARMALTSIVPDLPCFLVMVCILAKDPVIAHHPHTMTIRPCDGPFLIFVSIT